MGKHDQDNTKDGQWSRLGPRDDIRNDPQGGGGKHSGGRGNTSGKFNEPDEPDEPDEGEK